MELRHLRYFIAVAEELHFGRAAKRLNISQPPLSQQILGLEEELAVTLFDRAHRQVRLTKAGATFLSSARRILASVDAAAEQAQQVHRGFQGVLRVGHMAAAALTLLPETVNRHRQRYPDVTVTCVVTETVTTQLELLRAGSIDVGIVRLPVHADGLVVKHLGGEAMLLAVPDGHRLAGKSQVSWADLREVPFIYFPRHTAPELHDELSRYMARKGITMNVAMETSNFLTMLAYVAAGLGVALVLESAKALQRTGVSYVRIKGAPQVLTGVAYRAEAYVDLVPAFVKTVRETFKSKVAARRHA